MAFTMCGESVESLDLWKRPIFGPEHQCHVLPLPLWPVSCSTSINRWLAITKLARQGLSILHFRLPTLRELYLNGPSLLATMHWLRIVKELLFFDMKSTLADSHLKKSVSLWEAVHVHLHFRPNY